MVISKRLQAIIAKSKHLVAKNISEPLNVAMSTMITAVNKIKAHALNSRLFKKLRCENDEEFDRLLIHTEAVKIFIIAFPTSYLVERGFSVVSQILTKSRNRLNVVERGDLRLQLTSMTPDVQQLMSQRQIHPSH
ncbi:hypothetical protein EGW08_020093 [Elysia chlorotica]|uniref:HAT C-terminal dimerisation domain-containing protein n=1 Tax=Elysia chlorotica TaxID=188477 RepID=A0A433SS99_ELYCH|nr:hypothetical protein EGW08_020093 [Elysia chlorotica]